MLRLPPHTWLGEGWGVPSIAQYSSCHACFGCPPLLFWPTHMTYFMIFAYDRRGGPPMEGVVMIHQSLFPEWGRCNNSWLWLGWGQGPVRTCVTSRCWMREGIGASDSLWCLHFDKGHTNHALLGGGLWSRHHVSTSCMPACACCQRSVLHGWCLVTDRPGLIRCGCKYSQPVCTVGASALLYVTVWLVGVWTGHENHLGW